MLLFDILPKDVSIIVLIYCGNDTLVKLMKLNESLKTLIETKVYDQIYDLLHYKYGACDTHYSDVTLSDVHACHHIQPDYTHHRTDIKCLNCSDKIYPLPYKKLYRFISSRIDFSSIDVGFSSIELYVQNETSNPVTYRPDYPTRKWYTSLEDTCVFSKQKHKRQCLCFDNHEIKQHHDFVNQLFTKTQKTQKYRWYQHTDFNGCFRSHANSSYTFFCYLCALQKYLV